MSRVLLGLMSAALVFVLSGCAGLAAGSEREGNAGRRRTFGRGRHINARTTHARAHQAAAHDGRPGGQ